jgi:hypothetical protein
MPLQRISGSMIQDGSVNTADLAAGAVVTADIADAAVTAAKLSPGVGSAGQFLRTDGSALSWSRPLVVDTAKASTSGSAVEFTGISSWVRRITVALNGVSTNGATNILVQLGTGGTPTTSGYAGYSVFSWASGIVPVNSTAGIPVFNNAASYNHYGHLVLTNISGNLWLASGEFVTAGTQGSIVSGGSVTLAGVANYLRVVTSNGTDAFDAGSINVLYE